MSDTTKRVVMTDDINNPQSDYPVMPLKSVDSAPTQNSQNLISSGAVYAAIFAAMGGSY